MDSAVMTMTRDAIDARQKGTLSRKQTRFVDEYLRTFNGMEAARRSGYKKYVMANNASKLMNSAKISAEIDRRMAESGIPVEFLTQKLMDFLSSNETDYYTWDKDGNYILKRSDELTEAQKSAIAEIKTTPDGRLIVKLQDKQAVIDKLLKIRGAYRDRLEVSGLPSPQINIAITENSPSISENTQNMPLTKNSTLDLLPNIDYNHAALYSNDEDKS